MAYRLDRTRRRPITVLSIAASDSGGGAGIQADLLTLAAHGVYGATAITAVTAQNTRGVFAAEPVRPELLLRQLETIFEDLSPAAVKIGALGSAANVRTVAGALGRWKARHVVLDPILGASTGEPLLWRGLAVLRRELLSRCELVTPNVPEAEALSGVRIRGEADRRLAAGIIADRGAQNVLIKGGHARGGVVSDLLFDGRGFREFRHPRIVTRATHGTGCTLSSAIAANLALGYELQEAVGRAIRYIEKALRRGVFPGRGRGVPGHF